MGSPASQSVILHPPAATDERARIKAVIEAESAAWLKGDIEEWKSFWVQDGHVQHVNARPLLGLRALYGFDEMLRNFAPKLRQNVADESHRPEINNENWRISIGADMAWATFDQTLPVDSATSAVSGFHHEMRILEKVRGDWKIAAVFHMPNRYVHYTCPWVRVDGSCHVSETGPGLLEALEGRCALRIVGNRLCGNSAADTRRLREAVAEAENLSMQMCPRQPAPLVLGDNDGEPMTPCWISIADSMIVILLHDDRLLGNAIAKAGKVFGLTPAQMRVAEAIARGHDLTATAKALNVRPNTVRTHVRRMFERTAVKSQPALVSKLLSVAPPT